MLASPALAEQPRQHTRQIRQVAPDAQASYGQRLMQGPSSQAGDNYVERATDPDPAIRSELLRDANVYNGNE
jgi:hypothetical protein